MGQRGVDTRHSEEGNVGSIPACPTIFLKGAIELARNKIPKAPLDEAIALTREYYHLSAQQSALTRITACARQIEDETGILWINMENILSAILSNYGINPDATNADIYAILRRLGWEVAD